MLWPRLLGYAADGLGLVSWPLFAARHPDLARLIKEVKSAGLTYLSRPALRDLVLAVRNGPDAAIVEAGSALGGSAIVLAAAKRRSQPLYLYDTFGMIPPPTDQDGPDAHHRYRTIVEGRSEGIGEEVYYGYRQDLREEVRDNLWGFGFIPDDDRIHLVQGTFEDMLDVDYEVAVAHVDCDWYQSVRVCLARIGPMVMPGGCIVVDDYDHWSGARRAVDRWLDETDSFRSRRRSRLQLVRVQSSEGA